MNSVELFENSLGWLKKNYSRFRFYLERDIVYMLQTYLNDVIDKNSLPFKVYNDYPILPGIKRHLCADLVIKTNNKKSEIIDIAAEFKYEPDHKRKNKDILESKLRPTVVFWDGKSSVLEDIERARKYVRMNKANHAYSIFIDEGRCFCGKKDSFPDSAWEEWQNAAILIARFNR
jgi:hypothetical protein